MPRYFFQTEDGGAQRDTEGLELKDEAARLEAMRTLGQLIDLAPQAFWTEGSLTMTVTNERGDAVQAELNRRGFAV